MRNLDTSKAIGFNTFLKPEQYFVRDITTEEDLPKTVHFYPQIVPSKQPSESDQRVVSDKSKKILENILVDGKPFTDFYDVEIQVSSFNPHGYGEDRWKYYIVASLKSGVASQEPSIFKETLREMVKEAIEEVVIAPGKIESLADGISSATIIGDKWSKMVMNFDGVYDHIKDFEKLFNVAKGKFPTDSIMKNLDAIVMTFGKLKPIIQVMDKIEQRDRGGKLEEKIREGEVWDPATFEVLQPIEVWAITGEAKPTNAWYGAAQIHEPPTKKIKLNPGDTLYWSAMGVYGQSKGKPDPFKVILFQPKSPFEKCYGEYTDLWFKRKLEKNELRVVSDDVPRNLNYDSVIFQG